MQPTTPPTSPLDAPLSRRDLITRAAPAAAFLGAGLAASPLLAQARPPMEDSVIGRPAGGERMNDSDDSIVEKLIGQAYTGDEYALPELPYAYDALEPAIDAQTMQLHHDIHHQGYVDGLNKALKTLKGMDSFDDGDTLHGLQRAISFNGGGHLLHTIFWATMAPQAQGGGGEPGGNLAKAISKQFGSFANFKAYFSKAAGGVKGSGWGVLAYEPVGDNLLVFSINEHDAHLMANTHPLLPIDVWEHAYYLKYQNKRTAYIDAWFNVVNWGAVDKSYNWIRSRYMKEDKAEA